MRNWIMRWIASAVGIAHRRQPAHRHLARPVRQIGTLVVAVVVLGLVNAFVRPIIMFFVWPINCLTFGLLGFVINVLLFWVVGSKLVPGFHVDNFTAALIGSVLMGLFSGAINFLLADRGSDE